MRKTDDFDELEIILPDEDNEYYMPQKKVFEKKQTQNRKPVHSRNSFDEDMTESEDERPAKKKKSKSANSLIIRVTLIFAAVFLGMLSYFVYFEYHDADEVINSPYNKRQDILAQQVIRGNILADNGEVLATTQVSADGSETRTYPYGSLFAHVVGYSSNGKFGLELYDNFKLLTSNSGLLELVINDLKGQKDTGDNVVTTLNVSLQQAASSALGGNNGAIIAIDPETGKILTMVSKPNFDPNSIAYDWNSIINDEGNTCLLNRATNGLYPPGSTFKIMTLLEYIHEHPNDYQNYTFNCNGELTISDSTIRCYNSNVHGAETLTDSFAYSCNSSFANIGVGLNLKKFHNLCESMLFNRDLPLNMTYVKSNFNLTEKSNTFETMQTCIGQGKTQVTPIHMALIASSIANKGLLMKPYLVDHIENYEGKTVKNYLPEKYGSLMSESDATILSQYMRAVVEYGTAQNLQSATYTAYGKTGTAQFDETVDNSHSLFVGYADNGTKKIAICVVLEDMAPGSSAVPAARDVFDAYYSY